MPKGGYRAGAGRPKGATAPKAKPLATTPADIKAAAKESRVSPLEYMLAVMNDEQEDPQMRARMAIAAAPYVHARKSEAAMGKKEQAQEAAKSAGEGSEWGNDLSVAPAKVE